MYICICLSYPRRLVGQTRALEVSIIVAVVVLKG